MSEAILSIRGLSKTFRHDLFKKNQVAVSNLSCDFPKGKCIGFMGHNGAGKTTTIKTIFGLLKADQGEILFHGKPIQTHHKTRIGYMPEVNKLPKNLSSEEILLNHLKIFKPPGTSKKDYPKLIQEKLVEAELWDHRHKKVSELSKGMGRRLSWSQATIHDPELIILDEPFSGLDPLGRSLMSKLIDNIRAAQKTIILCTHELWLVNEICDDLHILQQGQLAYSTVNPVAEQFPLPLFNYKIEAAGLSRQTIEAMQERHQLPAWDYIDDYDFLYKLGFDEYIDAAKWVQALVDNGIILVSFTKHKGLEEGDLTKYFNVGA